ncbi:MAG: transketolase family protein [Planctomycetota bacterium]|jgi:transketolase
MSDSAVRLPLGADDPNAGTPGDVPEIDALAVNTIRTLSMDAVQAAASGHPGTPMALAPVAYALWQQVLDYDPAAPHWPGRDRFVLSNGHASMLLYSLLHLAGVKRLDESGRPTGDLAVRLEDIERFRQLDSRCPGHPEHGWTTGVETTTGPLGQGVATSVGMALAARWLGARYNRPGHELFSWRTWAICGDGCLMEGISSEAASLAGHLELSNLCWIHDNNHISIEGHTDLAFTEDVAARFAAYRWNVLRVADANDLDRLGEAYRGAIAEDRRPTLIVVDSHIGWGAPDRQDTSAAHGEPLGDEEIRRTKRFYGWPEDARFLVPPEVPARFAELMAARGTAKRTAWERTFESYRREHPELAAELDHIFAGTLPENWAATLPTFDPDEKGMATRVSSGKCLVAAAKAIPWIVGGAADLTPSTKTRLDFEGAGDQQGPAWSTAVPEKVDPASTICSPRGRNVHFGIREHAMAAIVNGMALIRLSALMELPVVHVFTHDSIGLGEDGPTHQPVEQLVSLRAVPGLLVFRPCDANEAAVCWRTALESGRPSVMVGSRQNLPTLDRSTFASVEGATRGGYVLAEAGGGTPEAILIATGSEVHPCLEARETLEASGTPTRVVSMPCSDMFDEQDEAYRESVLPASVTRRVSVEESSTLGWHRYVGGGGACIGMHTFGASAPIKELLHKFGFEPGSIVETVRRLA